MQKNLMHNITFNIWVAFPSVTSIIIVVSQSYITRSLILFVCIPKICVVGLSNINLAAARLVNQSNCDGQKTDKRTAGGLEVFRYNMKIKTMFGQSN